MRIISLVKFAFLLIIITVFLYTQNNLIQETYITLDFESLPKSFDGYRIVHLSDLHSKYFGANQEQLVSKVKNADPDLIVMTGDMVDSNRYDEGPVLKLVEGIKDIAPIFYIAGNHEAGSRKVNSLGPKLIEEGIIFLRNKSQWIERGKDKILIAGIDDPLLSTLRPRLGDRGAVEDILEKILGEGKQSYFKLLLSHRPELFSVYARYSIDLTFSGHAHGGQIRLPFVGGLVAPGQGLFPKYTSGSHIMNNSVMVISRGLGNSLFPQRLFNRPEVVVVTLKKR